MATLHIIQLHFPSEGAVGAMPEIEKSEKVFVLRTIVEQWFFADWSYETKTRKPRIRMVGHTACARGFHSEQLAQAFQNFLADHGHICEIFQIESGRLVRRSSPEPRQIPSKRPVLDIRENKKRGDWFTGR